MNLIQTIILSFIEGATEFLPVSSTAHLILFGRFLGLVQSEFIKSFEIIIQLGAILAVVVLYWQRLINNFKVWKSVIAAFIPTALVGFVLYKFIKDILFENYLVILASLLIGGVLLIVIEKLHKPAQGNISTLEDINLKQAMGIGLIQSLSVIPGVSRAAATILGGSALGLSRVTATEFSFILAVPTMMAATGLDILKTRLSFSNDQLLMLGLGFIGSFIFALIFIKWFIKYVSSHNFVWFGVYRIILSIVFFLLFFY